MGDAAATAPSLLPARGSGHRRARALAARRRRPDADAARRRPLLEGVREPDRARQDAPDRRDARLARGAARRRRAVPRARVSTDARNAVEALLDARRGARREATATARRSSSFRQARERDRPSSALPSSRCGRSQARAGRSRRRARPRGDRGPPARARARRAPGVLGRRPRRRALPARLLPVPHLEHPDGDRAPRRGARARGALGPAVRPPPRAHPRVALALPPPPVRLRGRARGRRARDRARAGDGRSAGRRGNVLPGFARRREDGALGARPPVRTAGEGDLPGAERRAEHRPPDAEPGRPAAPARPSRAGDRASDGSRSRSPSRPARSRTPHRPWEAWRRCTSTSATTRRRTSMRARHSTLLEGREDFLDEIGQSSLVLGRSLLERGRLDEAEQCFRDADAAFEQMASDRAPDGGVGSAGRSRGASGRRPRGSALVPQRRRGAVRRPLLRKGGSSVNRATTDPRAREPGARRRLAREVQAGRAHVLRRRLALSPIGLRLPWARGASGVRRGPRCMHGAARSVVRRHLRRRSRTGRRRRRRRRRAARSRRSGGRRARTSPSSRARPITRSGATACPSSSSTSSGASSSGPRRGSGSRAGSSGRRSRPDVARLEPIGVPGGTTPTTSARST